MGQEINSGYFRLEGHLLDGPDGEVRLLLDDFVIYLDSSDVLRAVLKPDQGPRHVEVWVASPARLFRLERYRPGHTQLSLLERPFSLSTRSK